MRRFLLAVLLGAAAPADAFQVDDGTWLLGLSAGLAVPQGGASKSGGSAGSLGGQAVYHPFGQWGFGLQADYHDFKAKGGNDLNASAAMGVVRGNFEGPSDKTMAYALFGLGFTQSGADLPLGGKDRGSGPGFELGGGYEYKVTDTLSAALELRLQRLMAPLPSLGLGGITVASIGLRLNFWLLPGDSPFP